MNVRFFAGTKAQYLAIPAHNPIALYFCDDTQELFWGDRLLTDGMRVVPTQADLPTLAKAADGTVYYVTETRNGYVLSPDRTKWLQTIYAPATSAYEVPESEVYNTVTTVGAVRDIEAKIYRNIEERFANIEIDDSVKAISFAGIELVEADGVFTIDRACARRALGFNVPEGKEDEEISLATEEFVEQAIAAIEIPEVPTKVSDFENDAGYLTEHQDLSHLADKEHVHHNYADKEHEHEQYLTEHQDLSDYAKKSDIPDVSRFITNIPSEYVTESELDSRGYLTEHQSLAGLATTQDVINLTEKVASVNTKVDMLAQDADKYLTHVPSEYITENELAARGYLTEHQALEEYAKKSDIEKHYVTNDELKENYTTTEQLEAKVVDVIKDKVDSGEINIKADAIIYGDF